MRYNAATRWLILFSFVFAIIIALYQARKRHDHGCFLFIILVLLFSLPFWIGNTILYNQFFVFLHNSVSTFYGLPATTVILTDPLGNILFGIMWTVITRHSAKKPYVNLQLGFFLIFIAFAILAISLFIHTHNVRISVIYPALTLLLFSFAQFLIQPTLHSRVSDLIANHHRMIFALGVLRSVRAIAAIIAFYLIDLTTPPNFINQLKQNGILYSGMAIIAFLFLIVFIAIKNKIIMHEKTTC